MKQGICTHDSATKDFHGADAVDDRKTGHCFCKEHMLASMYVTTNEIGETSCRAKIGGMQGRESRLVWKLFSFIILLFMDSITPVSLAILACFTLVATEMG